MLTIQVPEGTRAPDVAEAHFLACPRLDLSMLKLYTFTMMQPPATDDTLTETSLNGSPQAESTPTDSETTSPAVPNHNVSGKLPALSHQVAVRLGEYLGSGRTYDVYTAQMNRHEGLEAPATNIVVKFCDPWIVGTPDRDERLFGEEQEVRDNARDVIDAVAQEAGIYRRLQHTSIVPRFYGLWMGKYFNGEEHFLLQVMILEDVGACLDPLVYPSGAGNLVYVADRSRIDRRPSFLQLYKTLHEEGVVHGDVSSKHVHIRSPTFDITRIWDYPPASDEYPYSETRPDPTAATTLPLPSLCLIDFEGAYLRSDEEYEEELAYETRFLEHLDELACVQAKRRIESMLPPKQRL